MPAMATHVADKLAIACETSNSVACVGLDPRPELVPPPIAYMCEGKHDGAEAVAAAFAAFNRGLIIAIRDRCAAVKLQLSCYEAYGHHGIRAFTETVAYARSFGIPTIVDGKRSDIGSSATHYADAYLDAPQGLDGARLEPPVGADWLTVNPYLGHDGIDPFLGEPGAHGIFVLVRTSNPSGHQIQDLGEPSVAERIADLVAEWGRERIGGRGLSDVGAVVGATVPDEARRLRERMPASFFLVPGYGAQGASAADALAGRRPEDGGGVLVNSSRAIIGAWREHGGDGKDWALASQAALDRMNADLNAGR